LSILGPISFEHPKSAQEGRSKFPNSVGVSKKGKIFC
jgi:hypothetical protein